MKNNIIKAINNQLKNELNSAYIYLAMAAYVESINLKGFANWFKVQSQEEIDHAMGLYNHLSQREAKIVLQALPQPQTDYKNIEAVAAETLKHEQFITKMINNLYELAKKEKDYPLISFLQWYIDEQVEEEAGASELLNKVKMVGNNLSALYMLDKELLTRQYTPASILSKNI